ncbi:tetratricopeptide repeat protein [Kitasatospora sp. NPDC096147]|uniref:tetratricopeptide repeat protein n=1 Tax=Kitasatospora sp. NPDC096147 TaxID=3364093 RepID=UPI00380BF470
MEFDRRAQIRVRRAGTAVRGIGAGYLIAPRLVLTAGHLLDGVDPDGPPGTVTVRLPGTSERDFAATVRWRRHHDGLDAALIEADEHPDWPAGPGHRPPLRFGQLIGDRPRPVAVTGLPRPLRTPRAPGDGDGRAAEPLTGLLEPGTGALAIDPPAAVGRWSGLAGAAVLAEGGSGGDLLCGVVRQDRRADGGGTRLTVTSAHRLLDDPEFRELVTRHTGREPRPEPVEPAGLLSPASSEAHSLRSPAALLWADAEAVAFHGRDQELADLTAWCRDAPGPVRVRVLTGPGGHGKTRLARRLTEVLARQGWAVGHLRPDLTDGDLPDLDSLHTGLPLLLVVDDAETRPHLVGRLLARLSGSRHRVRLLLLARADGGWRTEAGCAAAPIVPLAPLLPLRPPTGSTDARRTAFHRAAADLARLLPRVSTLPEHDWAALADCLKVPGDLDHPRYADPLTLHVTALVTLLQEGPLPVAAAPGAPAEEILLEHEARCWAADAETSGLALPTAVLAATVATAVLCGSADRDRTARVLGAVPGLPADRLEAAAAWSAALAPTGPGSPRCSPLPGRIAEYHAARTLAGGGLDLRAVLGAADRAQRAQAVTVLARAGQAQVEAGRTAAGERELTALAAALGGLGLSYDTVRAAVLALPRPAGVLAPLALQLQTALVHGDRRAAVREPAVGEPRLAASLRGLGTLLAETGRPDEALAVTEQAVELWRRLATAETGRPDEAPAVTEQAVELRRHPAAADPAAHEPALADSLGDSAHRLAEAGRPAEGLARAEEATAIHRRLADSDPEARLPLLAGALADLGARLRDAGRRADALAVLEEAVALRRRLAAADPAAHGPELARSLGDLGLRLAEAGRIDAALTATEQAILIRRRLAEADPAAYGHSLAIALANSSSWLHASGRGEEGFAAAEEAVALLRWSAGVDPAAHRPELAAVLVNHGVQLARSGRHPEAVAAQRTAVEIYRRLDESTSESTPESTLESTPESTARQSALAGALFNLALGLGREGRRTGEPALLEQELTVLAEAVALRRRLARSAPAAHAPELGTALTAWATARANRGDLTGALHATGEAVEAYRPYVTRLPAALPRLRRTLRLQADLLSGLGREQEAAGVRNWLEANPLPVG